MAWRKQSYGTVLPTHRWQGLTRRQRVWRALRPWLGLGVLLAAIWAVNQWWPDPAALRGTRQTVSTAFHRCGQGQGKERGPNCVIDGDTFIMTTRHLRIMTIDAPEIGTKARCPQEAAQAEAAAAELLRLLNQGPFTMQPPQDGLRDDYGRELMSVTRQRPDGSVQDLAEDLIKSGHVRRYEFGPRLPWCPV